MIRLVGLSVLLVDDDAEFLALATRVFESMGVEIVATAQDAASAIAAAEATKPQAALVDVGLPDRNGVDLGTELAALPWGPRVVLTSTDSDVGRDVESRGVNLPFIAKENLATDRLRSLLGAD
jgi:DNA-binding NarL/FixJ family response regulator